MPQDVVLHVALPEPDTFDPGPFHATQGGASLSVHVRISAHYCREFWPAPEGHLEPVSIVQCNE